MREAAEADDDIPVDGGVSGDLRQVADQGNEGVVVRQVLGMLERRHEELPQLRLGRRRPSSGEGVLGEG